MNGEDDTPRPDATVFFPGTTPPRSDQPAEPAAGPEPDAVGSAEAPVQADDGASQDWGAAPAEAKVEAPPAWETSSAPGEAALPAAAPVQTGPPPADPTVFRPKPVSDGRLAVGAVLNNIYAIKRFIARGGMGEVYEGYNVTNPDDRVAIKVMLPALAADPNVRALFQNEAAILIRIHHPALVPYRVAAEDPTLGVYFIVTEFVDGAPLSEVLGELQPTPADLRSFARRLAEGLAAAHAAGAVHRDMSPDNVLLPSRRLEQAKIVDFGIAKNLDASKATIIGDGFAGKLGYGAPEQFGDFDRQIGPWTDVYSLGLVILALASGRNVDMGVTMVEAVDKRRAGPDLSSAPADLRPVLQQMLAANPAQRLRSMEAVVAALNEAPAPAAPSSTQPKAPRKATAADTPAKRRSPLGLLIGGGVVLVAAVAAILFMTTRPGGHGPATNSPGSPAAPSAAATAPNAGSAAEPSAQGAAAPASTTAIQQAIAGAVPNIACSWLDLIGVTESPGGMAVRLAGVAGRPGDAQSAVAQAGSSAGASITDIDLNEVAPVDPPVCDVLDAMRGFRDPDGGRLASTQRRFEMSKQANGKFAGRAVITLSPGEPTTDFSLIGIEPTGKMQMVIDSRAQFEAAKAAAAQTADPNISDLGGGAYRLQIDTDLAGWSGLLLITGKGPFNPRLLAGPPNLRGPMWADTIRSLAEKRGWKANMVWYKVVDETPG